MNFSARTSASTYQLARLFRLLGSAFLHLPRYQHNQEGCCLNIAPRYQRDHGGSVDQNKSESNMHIFMSPTKYTGALGNYCNCILKIKQITIGYQ